MDAATMTIPPSPPNADELLGQQRGLRRRTTPTPGPRRWRRRRKLAVVACMDSRMDIFQMLGLAARRGARHPQRRRRRHRRRRPLAGACPSAASAPRDRADPPHELRAAERARGSRSRPRSRPRPALRPWWALESFSDPYADVRQSIRRLQGNPFMLRKDDIRGFVYEVAHGTARRSRPRGLTATLARPAAGTRCRPPGVAQRMDLADVTRLRPPPTATRCSPRSDVTAGACSCPTSPTAPPTTARSRSRSPPAPSESTPTCGATRARRCTITTGRLLVVRGRSRATPRSLPVAAAPDDSTVERAGRAVPRRRRASTRTGTTYRAAMVTRPAGPSCTSSRRTRTGYGWSGPSGRSGRR